MNKKLKQLMEEKGVSMYALAKKLDIPVSTMTYKVNEKNLSAQYNELKAIAEALDSGIEDIID